MNRRRFLEFAAVGTGAIAGCAGGPTGTPTSSGTLTTTATDLSGATATRSPDPTPTNSPTESPRAHPDTIFVSPDGSDGDPGTRDRPLESVQAALDAVQPGETVRLTPGVHTAGGPDRPVGITRRGGEPDAPITIEGSPEAIVRGPPVDRTNKPIFHITHSYVHLRGLTLDGLTVPDEPGDFARYREQIVGCAPPTWQDSFPDYLTDVKITPAAVGNARGKLINAWRTNQLEIGGFEVIGIAGADHVVGDREGYGLGAVVSLGRSSNNFGSDHYPWTGPDESHDIHVHHIAHLAGHAHTELVKLHAGNYDVTIEYCTDRGGNTRSAVRLPGGRSVVRWCDLRNGGENGIEVAVPSMKENGSYDAFEPIPPERFPGTNNSMYGNRLLAHQRLAIAFSSPEWFDGGPHRQRQLCGNEIDGETEGSPGQSCPESVPAGDGLGHTGGDGPWGA